MSYFTTFYSYKGGVGRTLALANSAWLIANHPSEPARVLVIDFDLGAPGLAHVFGMKNGQKALGVLDYVTTYLEEARIPEIAEYIHRTAYPNIDIIPAGRMDSRYQRRLESIDWKDLYEAAHGYELIERFKSDISAVRPEYDYVFVDSLTGFTDVGGICVSQLPDLLILLFRLNQQNLDGIEKVYRAASSQHNQNRRKAVVPVITPSWPFLDASAAHWIKKAQKLFPTNKLLEVSFDSSLSFGERIISKEASELPLPSKILDDYRRLASQIRETNSFDPLTLWANIEKTPGRTSSDVVDLYSALLMRRPNVLAYWLGMISAFVLRFPFGNEKERSDNKWNKLLELLNQEAEAGNKFALLARARMPLPEGEKPPKLSLRDVERALEIDPLFSEALFDRAQIAAQMRQYEEAIGLLLKCLELASNSISKARIYEELAEDYIRVFDAKKALDAVENAILINSSDPSLSYTRAKALYLLGEYVAALVDAKKYSSFVLAGGAGSLLPSQILAAMGQITDASQELDSLSQRVHMIGVGNLAEAYIAVDPRKTIEMLQPRKSEVATEVRELLDWIARILLGEETASEFTKRLPNVHVVNESGWNVFELVAMLRAKERRADSEPEKIQLAYRALESSVEPSTSSRIRRFREAG